MQTVRECLDQIAKQPERNEAAVRTALMLGAEFFVDAGGYWQIKGIDHRSKDKYHVAWMHLVIHGICIDKDAKPVLCSEMHSDVAEDGYEHD